MQLSGVRKDLKKPEDDYSDEEEIQATGKEKQTVGGRKGDDNNDQPDEEDVQATGKNRAWRAEREMITTSWMEVTTIDGCLQGIRIRIVVCR